MAAQPEPAQRPACFLDRPGVAVQAEQGRPPAGLDGPGRARRSGTASQVMDPGWRRRGGAQLPDGVPRDEEMQRRVEQIEGTVIVESIPGQGTTLVIQIPIRDVLLGGDTT